MAAWIVFQSTRPLRGATGVDHCRGGVDRISIHAPLAGCDGLEPGMTVIARISIHAPLAGCDFGHYHDNKAVDISIHAPHAGRDPQPAQGRRAREISIHAPLAGRDRAPPPFRFVFQNFNPRTPCGVRQQTCTKIPYTFTITDKRNAFSRQTPSVRAFDRELRGGFHYKTRCEPSWKSLRASSSHYTIKVSSGR